MAALPEAQLPEIVELSQLSGSDLDPLLADEIEVWRERFAWDFRPSADLLRRFTQLHSLLGYALRVGRQVVGYSYFVVEGRKGLIGDFYVRNSYGGEPFETALLTAVVGSIMGKSGVKRIESQLMLLRHESIQLPFSHFLRRHNRLFMEAEVVVARRLPELAVNFQISFLPWTERNQEEIAHLVAAAYKGHIDSDINDQYRTVPGARHFLTNIIKYPGCGNFSPGASVVAIDSKTGRVYGVCLVSLISSIAGHITQLCILPAIRGEHLGYELLRRSLVRLADLGCTTVSLTVTCTNVSAIRLYESVGFRPHAAFPALVWEGF
ncbi:MAG: GNAT family N-acetyltransferase [Acidobacteriaceae bacterium]|nr:GNAT family N-acetyltransferase [Acidobacteriaceae bacterium]